MKHIVLIIAMGVAASVFIVVGLCLYKVEVAETYSIPYPCIEVRHDAKTELYSFTAANGAALFNSINFGGSVFYWTGINWIETPLFKHMGRR